MPVTAARSGEGQTRRALILAVIVVVVGVLATTLAQTQLLGLIPLRNVLKNTMHASREATAGFIFWATLPWYFKPLVGIVQDAFPLFGTRRRSYMLVAGALTALAWLVLGVTPYEYHAFLIVVIGINSATVVVSTAVGGYMVEMARASASSGRLTSVRNIVEQASYVISGVASGYLASVRFGWTSITCASVAFLVVPIALWCMNEQRTAAPRGVQVLKSAGAKILEVGRAGSLWMAAAVSFLFYFAPGIQTAQFYAQQNDLHMTTLQQGELVSMSGAFGVLSALLYGAFAAKRFELRTLLLACILFGASAQAAYAFYYSFSVAQIVDSYNGFGYTLAEVAMMHLAVRATPAGCEAMAFALMMAVRNFGLFGGDWLGAALQDHFHLRFHTLALINGAGSLLALPLVLLLPTRIVRGRDAQKPDPAREMAVDPVSTTAHGTAG
jgi:predicted MFS family arabinose efflux permease